ncbi:TetR/AcrR family transcriptional regulator [Catenulispora pinisilvae]|uniref:TetR/AcrR family transcriptional regulator n=1 Tax=Catenulispora pinisilvae TaxID=2705253 RepID=UPI001890D0BE|nr:TetR/AcrR family transcriptional regulator [Catenulispora pinisilvae]
MGTTTESPRQRYRAQVQEEIKQHAWEQIATAGASALSLNAIAKQMGMSGPALYRYFANRDELITALIRDAYQSLADTIRSAAAGGADLRGLAQAMRVWALEDPQRYLLIYGTPVPGYQAPDDTRQLANDVMTKLLEAAGGDGLGALPASALGEHLAASDAGWATAYPAEPERLHRAVVFWTRLHGVLSLELAGHFDGMGFDPARVYAAEVEAVAGH